MLYQQECLLLCSFSFRTLNLIFSGVPWPSIMHDPYFCAIEGLALFVRADICKNSVSDIKQIMLNVEIRSWEEKGDKFYVLRFVCYYFNYQPQLIRCLSLKWCCTTLKTSHLEEVHRRHWNITWTKKVTLCLAPYFCQIGPDCKPVCQNIKQHLLDQFKKHKDVSKVAVLKHPPF